MKNKTLSIMIATATLFLLFTVSANAQDSYEPDNSAGAASSISSGSNQSHSFHVAGDEDWVEFGASEGDILTLETELPVGGDTTMTLYGPGSRVAQLEYDDDGGPGLASRIERVLAAGTYWAKIEDYGNNSTLGEYRLTMSLESQIPTTYDVYELKARGKAIEDGDKGLRIVGGGITGFIIVMNTESGHEFASFVEYGPGFYDVISSSMADVEYGVNSEKGGVCAIDFAFSEGGIDLSGLALGKFSGTPEAKTALAAAGIAREDWDGAYGNNVKIRLNQKLSMAINDAASLGDAEEIMEAAVAGKAKIKDMPVNINLQWFD